MVFRRTKVMSLMEKYLSRVETENKKPKKLSYKIYSKILEDYLWIVTTDKARKELIAEGVKDAIYTQEEVAKLMDEGISKAELVAIHKIKKAFPGSSIEDLIDEDTNG